MSKNPKIALVEAYIQALCDHDLDAISGLFAEGATIEDPVGSPAISGREPIREFYQTGFSGGLSARLLGSVRIAGNELAFPFVVEMNPGNGEMRLEIIDHFVLNEDNKIIAMRAFWGVDNTSTP